MQDFPEPRFTLTGSRSRCTAPSTLVNHTSLPRCLVGCFISSKHCPTSSWWCMESCGELVLEDLAAVGSWAVLEQAAGLGRAGRMLPQARL
jgi:hypothetical protein